MKGLDVVGNIPKVFISYSWTTPEHEEKVISLAERLMSHGINVTLDKWDLKEGQDKYAFMEQCVTDSDVDRVLLICDKAYVDKANQRKGGVGDETVIITPEIYGKANQDKFIPIVFELDENNIPYLPAYIKSRIYIDLSSEDDKYESEYDKLLRNIHKKPLYKKPAIGKRPEWIEDEKIDFSQLRDIIKQLKGYTGNNKAKEDYLLRKFNDSFSDALKSFILENGVTGEIIAQKINEMKPVRDMYIDYLEILISNDRDWSNIICESLESIYNGIFQLDANRYNNEHISFFFWNLFISITAMLYHFEKYSVIHDIVTRTYFLNRTSSLEPYNYTVFREYYESLEGSYKSNSSTPNLTSMTSEILISQIKYPYLTCESITFADILLCQLSFALDKSKDYNNFRWFADSYIYNHSAYNEWVKMKSRRYCEKILKLYGADSVEDLKSIIYSNPVNVSDYSHKRNGKYFPALTAIIKEKEIASMP